MSKDTEYVCDPKLVATAREQTTKLLFVSLGRFEGKVSELLDAITAAAAVKGKVQRKAALKALFAEPDGAHLQCVFEPYRLEQLPMLYSFIMEQLLTTLVIRAKRQAVEHDWLHQLQPGDEVAVCDDNGAVLVEYVRVTKHQTSLIILENGDIYTRTGERTHGGVKKPIPGRCLRHPDLHRKL